jgi:uncharacterized protein (TIGR03435 family)
MTARFTLFALVALCALAGPAIFDVASVKVSHAPDAVMFMGNGAMDAANGRMRVPSVGGNVSMTNWSMTSLINAAWDLGSGQLSGPGWMGSDRYDILAKTSPNATQSDLRIMLQALLADRFKMVTHRETKDTTVYALVAPKGAAKLKATTGDERSAVLFAPPSRMIGRGSTMQALALALSFPTGGHKIVDQTGISGAFDFTLSYSADDGVDGAPSIFTALQDQLGLKLEPQKGQTEVLVIDHAERVPIAN